MLVVDLVPDGARVRDLLLVGAAVIAAAAFLVDAVGLGIYRFYLEGLAAAALEAAQAVIEAGQVAAVRVGRVGEGVDLADAGGIQVLQAGEVRGQGRGGYAEG